MGKVFCANRKVDNQLVGLKFFGYCGQQPSLKSIQSEIDIMVSLRGLPGTLHIHGIFMDSITGYIEGKRYQNAGYPVIVMDFLQGKNKKAL